MSGYPLQRIRRAYEAPVERALKHFSETPFPVYTDNQYYADKKGNQEFALVRFSFGDMHELTIGGMMENIRGSLIVEIYVPKGGGPGRAQAAAEAVLVALSGLNATLTTADAEVVARTGPISGPALTPLRSAPHFQARLSCSIRASYRAL